MIERRENARYEMELPVTLRTRGKLIPGACLDISAGGLCLLTDFTEEIEEGLVEVVVDLSPRYRDVALRGRVLRFQKGVGQRVAVQFTSPDSKGMQTLKNFLSQQVN
ncbi:MAG: PilZ domain-containing protein [Deltaproteobacteria bacterium]|nr:PilZ domain-containing protein [Deltaproteobacteria bacterium]MBI4224034.1 PilZ domain-containing protein [Deltaproteobacteria bacterium]